ncbi:tetratricopeptide repeat protein [Croceibacterium salegens]|uniref:tetratricopeptide repeat protein n=1 Tax=Croceibacterium salegens TaxID=1737568 RepID=UPI001358ECFF|nr:tetratricopeptide repeat protein [Croceibacterium salegens]
MKAGFVQTISRFFRETLRNGTLCFAMLGAIAGCSDSANEAATAGATAQQQLERGDLAEAKRSISKAIAARDDIVDLHLLKGRIELASGAPSEAFDAYFDALALDRSNGEALQAVSQLGLETGHFRESLEATEQILALAPQQPEALLIRGQHAFIQRRFDEAISYADQIPKDQVNFENASILKARALLMEDMPEDALDVVNAVSQPGGDSAEIALTKLEIFRTLRRPEQMKLQFERLRKLRPKDLELRIDEANLLFKQGDRTKAIDRVSSVLLDNQAKPDNVEQILRLWWEYGAQDAPNKLFEAIASSTSVHSRASVASFLIDQGRNTAARRIIETLDEEDRRGLLARLLAAEGEFAQAKRTAESVLIRDSTQCDALLARSEANLGLRLLISSLRDAQQAASECPNQASNWLVAARAYTAMGQLDGADRIFSQALDENPQNLRIAQTYSDWLLQEGRRREAVAIARRFTTNSPASLAAWRLYEVVCNSASADCVGQAAEGFRDALTRFGIDPAPGSPRMNRFLSQNPAP